MTHSKAPAFLIEWGAQVEQDEALLEELLIQGHQSAWRSSTPFRTQPVGPGTEGAQWDTMDLDLPMAMMTIV